MAVPQRCSRRFRSWTRPRRSSSLGSKPCGGQRRWVRTGRRTGSASPGRSPWLSPWQRSWRASSRHRSAASPARQRASGRTSCAPKTSCTTEPESGRSCTSARMVSSARSRAARPQSGSCRQFRGRLKACTSSTTSAAAMLCRRHGSAAPLLRTREAFTTAASALRRGGAVPRVAGSDSGGRASPAPAARRPRCGGVPGPTAELRGGRAVVSAGATAARRRGARVRRGKSEWPQAVARPRGKARGRHGPAQLPGGKLTHGTRWLHHSSLLCLSLEGSVLQGQ